MEVWQRLYPRKSLGIDDPAILTNASQQPIPRAAETSITPAAVLSVGFAGAALK